MKKVILLKILFLFISLVSFSQTNETIQFEKTKGKSNSISNLKLNPKMDNYDVVYYGLNIEATNENALISSAVATIKAKVLNSPLTEFVIQLKNALTVTQVKLNNQAISYTHQNDEILLEIPTSIAVGEFFIVEINYSGTPQGGGWQCTTSSSGTQVTWTVSESFHAFEWFPVKQSLTDKADSSDVYITVPSSLKAVSNGILKAVVDVSGNKKRYEWKSRYPIDYYLISVTISDYIEYNTYANIGLSKPLLIQNYVYNVPNLLNQYKSLIDATSAIMELFSNKFGTYPFANEKYGHVMAPIGGGMEHQTITSLSSFQNGLIAHELGHMWFGDYVTCSSWQDIWINEGFASYTEYINLQYLSSQANADNWMLSAQNAAKLEPEGSVFLSLAESTNENRIFSSRLSYKKGAVIIHMLRNEINDDVLFYKIIKEFLQRYAYKTASGADFKNVVNEQTSKDFSWFFDQWYYGYGFPTFYFNHGFNTENKSWITVSQSPSSSLTPFFKVSMELKLTFDDNSTSNQRLFITENPQTFTFDLPKIKSIQVDPKNWVLKGTSTITSNEIISDDLNLSIGPNPFKNKLQFYIPNDFQNTKVTIIDITGKVINQSTHNEPHFEVDGSNIPKGLYFIRVETGKKTTTRKLEKQ